MLLDFGFLCYANHFMKMHNYVVLGIALKTNHHFVQFLSDFCVKVFHHEYFVLQDIPFTLQCHNLVVNIIIIFFVKQ